MRHDGLDGVFDVLLAQPGWNEWKREKPLLKLGKAGCPAASSLVTVTH